jgi:tetratricopeptide (TPR) repeat protein
MAQDRDREFSSCVGQFAIGSTAEFRLDSCSAVIERKNEVPEKIVAALSTRGWIELSGGDHSKAIADFDAALKLNTSFDWALVGRAAAYLNSDRADQAISDYDQLIARHPNDPRLLVGRGDAYNNIKQYDRGIADFDRALVLAPRDEEAMNDRAWALVRQGKFIDAIRGYDAAALVSGEFHSLVLGNRCEAKAMIGEIDAALVDCNAALKLEPGKSNYLEMRGFANLKGERLPAAIADYEAALAADASDSFALFGRGIARLRIGQRAAGQADIAAAEKMQPKTRANMAELGITIPSD